MDSEQNISFEKEIESLCKKYYLANCAFCGSTEDGIKFIGVLVGSMTPLNMFETSLNVGRLWQHVRNTVRGHLDTFDGWGR